MSTIVHCKKPDPQMLYANDKYRNTYLLHCSNSKRQDLLENPVFKAKFEDYLLLKELGERVPVHENDMDDVVELRKEMTSQ